MQNPAENTPASAAGVAAIPCSMFREERHSGKTLVRFCFCKREATLEQAVDRLEAWLRKK